MSSIQKLIVESIDLEFAAILEEGKKMKEDDDEDDKSDKSDDTDDKKDGGKDDEDDEDDSGKEKLKECDCEDDDDEDDDKKDMKESYDFAGVTSSSADASVLKKLFAEVDAKEQADLWKEVQKSPEDCQKIIKYAKTII